MIWHRDSDDVYGDRLVATPAGHTVARPLNEVVEFGRPFRVTDSGNVEDEVSGIYAPDVTNDVADDVFVSDDDWEPLIGYTGQCGYGGAVMHPSEQLAGGLARDILETPGVYVVVEVRGDDGELPDGDPIGWTVLRRVG